MLTNGSSPTAPAKTCSCKGIAHVLRSLAVCVDELHGRGRKHDEAYILTLIETGLGAALFLAKAGRKDA